MRFVRHVQSCGSCATARDRRGREPTAEFVVVEQHVGRVPELAQTRRNCTWVGGDTIKISHCLYRPRRRLQPRLCVLAHASGVLPRHPVQNSSYGCPRIHVTSCHPPVEPSILAVCTDSDAILFAADPSRTTPGALFSQPQRTWVGTAPDWGRHLPPSLFVYVHGGHPTASLRTTRGRTKKNEHQGSRG